MEITIIISIVSVVIAVVAFFLGRKDKSNQETEKDSYKWGSIDEKLANIEKTLTKIEDKLDTYEDETKKIVEEEINKHILQYHH